MTDQDAAEAYARKEHYFDTKLELLHKSFIAGIQHERTQAAANHAAEVKELVGSEIMTKQQARLIVADKCIESLIEACKPSSNPSEAEYLYPLHAALKVLLKELKSKAAGK